jgi:hypothetical protein
MLQFLHGVNTPQYKLCVFSLQATFTDRTTALFGVISANFLRTEGVAWSAQRIPTAINLNFIYIYIYALTNSLVNGSSELLTIIGWNQEPG